MATKDQERKALAQIRKIIEGLGEESYLGFAFEGCLEVAEQNIENDWACSLKQRAESAEMRIESQAKDIERLTHCKEYLEKKVAEAEPQTMKQANRAAKAEDALDAAEKEAAKMQKRIDFLEDQIKVMKEDYEDEIIRLKAKLYDLLTK